jgi:D-proline reductase (dithiol) PrdB
VALIASGGIYRVGQVAFTHKDDTSVRRIATDVDMAELRASHFAYDLTDARRDPNVVFPLEPLRRLVADGTIGSLTSHALTFMGGIYSQRRVTAELVPQIERELDTMAADVALLVPV